MAYNSFFTNVISRLVFLLGTFVILAWLLVNTSRFFTIFFLSLIAILQVINLIYFLNKTNRELARFLLLLTEEDTSVLAWKERVEKTFRGLHHSFRKVNEEISRYRLEKEKGNILLQNVIDYVNTGIFVLDDSGEVLLVNEETLKIFGMKRFDHLDDLNSFQEGLANGLLKLRYNSGNIFHVGPAGNDLLPVMFRVSALRLGDQNLRIFAVQSIKNELEANEIESWQKLTRVLAHEISNSVTPLATLGSGIHRKLSQATKEKGGGMSITKPAAADLLQSAELIEKRSNALVDFMEHYKSFTRLPDPVPEMIEVSGFFENLRLLFSDELSRQNILLEFFIDDTGLKVQADRGLLEQAFINLIKNSLEALEGGEKGCIRLRASYQDDSIYMEITDDGPGIPADIQSQVFIPFFTTKQGGSGIGMSIVRKIVILCGGSIELMPALGQGARFIIKLPAPGQG